MKILVRLPNWLGDLVMSSGFIRALSILEPDSTVDVIVKDSLSELIPLFEGINAHIPFSKVEYPGIFGAIKFGRTCSASDHYDMFFTLPDSFSSNRICITTALSPAYACISQACRNSPRRRVCIAPEATLRSK